MTGKLRLASIGMLAVVTTAGGLVIAAGSASAGPAPAQTRWVATTGDDGLDPINDCTVKASPCKTVQHAVDEAAAGDTVSILDKGPYHESVHIRKPLTIVGQGATGANRTVIDGNGDAGPSLYLDGVDVNAPTVVTVKDVAVDGNGFSDGIRVLDATLHLIDSTASNNDANGINLQGISTATVEGSTVSNNKNVGIDGFAQQAAQRVPAAAVSGVDVTVSNSDVSDNANEGIDLSDGSLGVDHSTINRNADGGVVISGTITATIETSTLDSNIGAGLVVDSTQSVGILRTSTVSNTKSFPEGTAFGSGVITFGGTATVADSTLSGNSGSGVLNLGGAVSVANSTVSGTHAGGVNFPNGGLVTVTSQPGLRTKAAARFGAKAAQRTAQRAVANPAISVIGSIVAEQDAKVPDCSGTITDGGYNLSSDAANSCGFAAAKNDQIKTDPLLGPLADNGGPTMTEILKKHSPAIDAIPAGSANCKTGTADQRGVARPQPTGGKCDVGAVELAAQPIVIHPDKLHDGTVGKKYTATITATGGQYPVYAFSLAAGSLPNGLTMSSTGQISGTPTKAGTFHFTVSVNDPVLKDYTIVIEDAAPNGNGSEPIAATGAPVMSMTAIAGGAIFAGFLLMVGAGLIGRRPGRHRARD